MISERGWLPRQAGLRAESGLVHFGKGEWNLDKYINFPLFPLQIITNSVSQNNCFLYLTILYFRNPAQISRGQLSGINWIVFLPDIRGEEIFFLCYWLDAARVPPAANPTGGLSFPQCISLTSHGHISEQVLLLKALNRGRVSLLWEVTYSQILLFRVWPCRGRASFSILLSWQVTGVEIYGRCSCLWITGRNGGP